MNDNERVVKIQPQPSPV